MNPHSHLQQRLLANAFVAFCSASVLLSCTSDDSASQDTTMEGGAGGQGGGGNEGMEAMKGGSGGAPGSRVTHNADAALVVTGDAGVDTAPIVPPPAPTTSTGDDPKDFSTRTLTSGRVVKTGWNQIDLLPKANWDGAMAGCPDPDAMVVPGTVDFKGGTWTLTGSGEGFMHGWDQGNLVYLEKRIKGDFDFTAQVSELVPNTLFDLNGAAEAVLNVRDGLDYKAPANSVVAGRMREGTIFFGRFNWKNESPENGAGKRSVENKYWYWPAWPDAWPKETAMGWYRISRRGLTFSAYVSKTGAQGDWQEIKNADTQATWYPYKLKTFGAEAILGLVCTARNDRNLAPKKPDGCRDENSSLLKQAARCTFKNVSVVQN